MMKKRIAAAITSIASASAVFTAVPITGPVTAAAANEPVQMEYLDRGTVAIKTTGGVYLSWRLLGTEEYDTAFDIYRDGTRIDTVSDSTNYTDKEGTTGSNYAVVPKDTGVSTVKAVSVKANSYFDIPVTLPAAETITSPSGETVGTFDFGVTDCSTADLDGDGEYEIITKMVSSEHDVGSPGDGLQSLSGTVRFNAYKLDGTRMWEQDINLGKNVYSSAHTVQFLAYDFNLDGKAEMICQTSLGSTDGKGEYVSHAAKTDKDIQKYTDEQNVSADYRSDWGPITQGEEFLTVFNGETGEAIDTIDFPTARVGNGSSFGDTSGNRSNRFTASVAYLDGQKPYAVYLRGYYFGRNGRQRTGVSGTSFDGEKLSVDYRFDTEKGQPGYYEGADQYVGNGNHNCAVADVDGDGKDEFLTGALCMEVKDDNSFKPRWCTFMEHGDALHLGDYDPTRTGMEFFTVHEDSGPNAITGTPINYGMSVIDADSGNIVKHWDSGSDNGRGIMANIGAGGYYQVTSANAGTYRADGGDKFTAGNYGMSMNFRIFWDGDTYDELLDGTSITNWNGGRNMASLFDASKQGCVKINGTKSNPALQADILGDWREEVVYPTTDGSSLRVFTTTTPTEHKLYTLMHDRAYRMQVSSEQTAYNQPPHIGYYISENNDEYDARKGAAFIKTVHDNVTDMRSAGKVTINFIDGSGKPIDGKESVTVTAPVGSRYSVSAEYLADFGLDETTGMCWRYKSGNEPVAVGENSNVINLVFNWVQAEITYSVNAVDENGNTIKTLKSGKARPGAETVTCYGDYGIIADGSYYVLADTAKNSVSFSPAADDNTRDITYKRVSGSGEEWDFEDSDISAVETSDYVQTKTASNDTKVLIPSNGSRAFKMVTSTDADKGGSKGAGTSTAHLALANIDASKYMTGAKKAAVSYDVYFPNTNGPRMTANLLDALPPADNWASGWSRIGFNGRDGYSVEGEIHADCANSWVHGTFILDFGTGKVNYTYYFTETGTVIATGTKTVQITGNSAIKPTLAAVNLLSWTGGTTAYMDNIAVIGYDENAPVPTLPPTASPTAPPVETQAPTPKPPAAQIPQFSIEGYIGGKRVTITTETDGAEIHYTTDGSAPTAESELYNGPIELTETKTIKAIAVKAGLANSAVASGRISVTKVETPSSSHEGGELAVGTVITLKTSTSGATIYYTTDGTEPTVENGTKYNGSIVITKAETIKAIAVKNGSLTSDIYTVEYTVPAQGEETLTLSVGSATVKVGENVSVPVYIFTSSGEAPAFTVSMSYDSTMFAFKSVTAAEGVEEGDLYVSQPVENDDGTSSVIVKYENITEECGEMFSLDLEALPSALDGDYKVTAHPVNIGNLQDIEDGIGTITLKGSVNSNLSVEVDSATLTDAGGNTIENSGSVSGEVMANVTVDGVEDMPENQESVKANIILAVYDRDHKLITVSQSEADLKDTMSVFSSMLEIPEGADVGSIRLMIWNSLNDMSPFADAKNIFG